VIVRILNKSETSDKRSSLFVWRMCDKVEKSLIVLTPDRMNQVKIDQT